jgi:Sulfotransferase family
VTHAAIATPPQPPLKRPLRQRLRQLSAPVRSRELEAYLRKKLGVWLSLSSEALDDYPVSRLAEQLNEDWAFLSYTLLKDLGLRFYPSELRGIPSIASLAHYLSIEIDPPAPTDSRPSGDAHAEWLWEPVAETPERRSPRAGFVLSTPRSGSTLMRVMLAGHPDIFAPPELYLLPFRTMRSREHILRDHGYQFMDQGLIQTVSNLYNLSTQQSAAKISQWIEQDLSIQQVYELLQDAAPHRLIIDKTPFYSASAEWMDHAERLFEGPRHIFLIRHPYSMIESFVRMRFHRMIGNGAGIWDNDPYLYAAKVWDRWNRNILSFLKDVDPARHHLVRYEDLVTDPETTVAGLCSFLHLPFHSAMLRPYDENRMTYAQSKNNFTVGDPNFATRERLDPALANWSHIRMPAGVKEITRDLAGQLGYETP